MARKHELELVDELRRQREEQQIILDAMPAMVWYKDRHNRILRANRAAAAATNRTAGELVGASTYDLYPDEAAAYHRDDLEVIESGRPKLGIVEQLQTATGEKRWVRTDKIPYRDENGEIVGVIVFAIDITDRKLAEEALERARQDLERRVDERTSELRAAVASLRAEVAEREKLEAQMHRQQVELAHVLRLQTVEGVAAELAHEINQPLGAIANFASGLVARLQQGADPSTLLAGAEQIAKQALRAAEVLRRLRDFTRKTAPRRELMDLNALVRDAVSLVEPDVRRHAVEIRLCLAAPPPQVLVDGVQVVQVILNLAINGVEAIVAAGEPHGCVTIETRAAGTQAEVLVSDTGTGLSPEAQQHLFEPFFTTKRGGLGMGLSIARGIVEGHGGRLVFEPANGAGATFSLTLPIADQGAGKR